MNITIPKPIVTSAKVSTRPPKTAKTVRQNMDWLKQHHAEYLGQWVALHDGALLGAHESFAELHRTLKQAGLLKMALFMSLHLEPWKSP